MPRRTRLAQIYLEYVVKSSIFGTKLYSEGELKMPFYPNQLHYFLDLLRNKTNHECGYSLFNILNTWKISRGNKIINEDFSHIDFGYIPLNNIDFGDDEHPSSFRGATLSDENYVSGHVGKILCSAISPNNKYILTGGEDKTAILWETNTGFVHAKIEMQSEVEFVIFSDDSCECFIGARGEWPVVFDIQNKEIFECIKDIHHSCFCGSTVFSSNGHFCFCGGQLNSIIKIDMNNHTQSIIHQEAGQLDLVACSGTGEILITSNHLYDNAFIYEIVPQERSHIQILNTITKKTLLYPQFFENYLITKAEISPDNETIYVFAYSPIHNCNVLDIITLLHDDGYLIANRVENIETYLLSHDGKLCLTYCDDIVNILDTSTWKRYSSFGRLQGKINLGVFSYDNEFCALVLESDKNSIYIYNCKLGSLIKKICPQREEITSIFFSEDGNYFFVSCFNMGLLWNTKTWNFIVMFGGCINQINRLFFFSNFSLSSRFSYINSTLLATLTKNSIKIWSNANKTICPINALGDNHNDIIIEDLINSEDGRFLSFKVFFLENNFRKKGFFAKCNMLDFKISYIEDIDIIALSDNYLYSFSPDYSLLFLADISDIVIYDIKNKRIKYVLKNSDENFNIEYALFSNNNSYCFFKTDHHHFYLLNLPDKTYTDISRQLIPFRSLSQVFSYDEKYLALYGVVNFHAEEDIRTSKQYLFIVENLNFPYQKSV